MYKVKRFSVIYAQRQYGDPTAWAVAENLKAKLADPNLSPELRAKYERKLKGVMGHIQENVDMGINNAQEYAKAMNTSANTAASSAGVPPRNTLPPNGGAGGAGAAGNGGRNLPAVRNKNLPATINKPKLGGALPSGGGSVTSKAADPSWWSKLSKTGKAGVIGAGAVGAGLLGAGIYKSTRSDK